MTFREIITVLYSLNPGLYMVKAKAIGQTIVTLLSADDSTLLEAR